MTNEVCQERSSRPRVSPIVSPVSVTNAACFSGLVAVSSTATVVPARPDSSPSEAATRFRGDAV
jgi:hypothetical protein